MTVKRKAAVLGEPVKLAAPKGWTKGKLAAWRSVIDPLCAAGRVAPEDAPACEAFALAVATVREAQAMIDREGMFVESPNGYRVAHPAVAVRDKSASEVRAWSARFGCTMRDRDVLRIGTKEAEKPTHEKVAKAIGESPAARLRMVR